MSNKIILDEIKHLSKNAINNMTSSDITKEITKIMKTDLVNNNSTNPILIKKNLVQELEKKVLSFTNDHMKYVKYFVLLFLTVYASMAVNNLPDSIVQLFNNELFKFAYLILLVIFVLKKEYTISILLALGFVLSIRFASIKRIDNKVNDGVNYLLFKNTYKNNQNDQRPINHVKVQEQLQNNENNLQKEVAQNSKNVMFNLDTKNDKTHQELNLDDKYASF